MELEGASLQFKNMSAKLRISERNAKGKLAFLFISELKEFLERSEKVIQSYE